MADLIPLTHLLYLLLPLIATGYLYYRWCGKRWELGYASIRMVGQLLLIGYTLVFLFGNDSTWVGICVLVTMILMSSIIAVRPFKKKSTFTHALLSVFTSGSVLLVLIIYGVLGERDLYVSKKVIPIAGMLYSSAMNTLSIAGERYYSALESGKSPLEARSEAFHSCMIPKVNTFLAVGLVSLPGMMTGQILSGVSPLIAVRYQIMVMLMLLGSGGLSAAMYLWLATRKTRQK